MSEETEPRPRVQPVRFVHGERDFTASASTARTIRRELARVGGPEAEALAARIARAMELHGSTSVEIGIEDEIVLARALDSLRRLERRAGSDLEKRPRELRDRLVAELSFRSVSYDVLLVDGWLQPDSFASYAGPFGIGHHLALESPVECWQVVEVEENPDAGNERLVCRRCREPAHVSGPTE
jgi:hypothetical protein